MFFEIPINACGTASCPVTTLDEGKLCLTFDDGPGETALGAQAGPQTLAIAQYLADLAIPATFFFTGNRIREFPTIPREVAKLGHIVANHSLTHTSFFSLCDMTSAAFDRQRIIREIDETDRELQKCSENHSRLFRAPYGDWPNDEPSPQPASGRTQKFRGLLKRIKQSLRNVEIRNDLGRPATDLVLPSRVLNADPLSRRYVGPIGWDIDGGDWRYSLSAEKIANSRRFFKKSLIEKQFTLCKDRYRASVEGKRRGIVLFHDNHVESFWPFNRTLDLVRTLIPEWQRAGFQFVRLDALPTLASAMKVDQQVAIKSVENGRFWRMSDFDGPSLKADCQSFDGSNSNFGLIPMGETKVAFRNKIGKIIEVDASSGELGAYRWEIGESAVFRLIPTANCGQQLQAFNGKFVSASKDASVTLNSDQPGCAEEFDFQPL